MALMKKTSAFGVLSGFSAQAMYRFTLAQAPVAGFSRQVTRHSPGATWTPFDSRITTVCPAGAASAVRPRSLRNTQASGATIQSAAPAPKTSDTLVVAFPATGSTP